MIGDHPVRDRVRPVARAHAAHRGAELVAGTAIMPGPQLPFPGPRGRGSGATLPFTPSNPVKVTQRGLKRRETVFRGDLLVTFRNGGRGDLA